MTRTDNPTTAEPLLDLQRVVVAVRRRRRLWLTAGLLGVLGGLVLAVFIPAPPTAVTQLMIVHEDDQAADSGNLMETDIALLHTTHIANLALDRIGSDEPATDFLKTYEGLGLTNNMMEISVEGKTPQDAVRRAQALADAFITDHVQRVQTAADADARALISQRDRTQAELKDVNAKITRASAAAEAANRDDDGDGVPDGDGSGVVSSTESETLFARRAELTAKISDLTNRAEEAGIGAPRVKAGTQIVDAPRVESNSVIVNAATNAAIGLGLAMTAGIALAAVIGVVRDKPVLRKDIAAHLGASVVAQLPVPRRGLARLWRGRRAGRERKRVAATLVRLVRSGSGPVSVLELGSRRIAAALVLDVATELATDRDVVIVEDPAGRVVSDDLPGRDLGELTGRADRPIRIIGADQTAPGLPGETRIGIGSVAPGTAWTDLAHLGGETLLVVRTGFANTAWLHSVARQLADCRIPIVGIVLVDPDPRDKSDGTLWDGLHTALRGRIRPAGAIEAATRTSTPDSTPDSTPEPDRIPAPSPERVPGRVSEPVAKPAPERAEPAVKHPVAAHYPAPVPANGVNGVTGTADVPTKRFAPAQPHLNGKDNGADHDLPTKRFAPVRPEDVEELAHRRTNG